VVSEEAANKFTYVNQKNIVCVHYIGLTAGISAPRAIFSDHWICAAAAAATTVTK
jgi:hypothetical protein